MIKTEIGVYMASKQLLSEKRNLCSIVKYIAALVVVNGHIFLFHLSESPLAPFMNLGAACVTLFFFLSGYGLIYSYRKSPQGYLKSFFRHRIGRVILPLVTAYLITLPVYALLRGSVEWRQVIDTLAWGGPYLKYSWYVTEIIAVYILFFVSLRIGKTLKFKLTLLSILIMAVMGVLVLTNQPLWYAVSLPGFIMGIWFQPYEKRIYVLFSRRGIILIGILALALWFITWQWPLLVCPILSTYRYEFMAKFLSNVFFPIIMIAILYVMRESGTSPLSIVISSSYEVYLIQNCAMIIAGALAASYTEYWLSTMLIVVILAIMQYSIDRFLLKFLKI